MDFVSYGEAKDRKAILRALKPIVEPVLKGEHKKVIYLLIKCI